MDDYNVEVETKKGTGKIIVPDRVDPDESTRKSTQKEDSVNKLKTPVVAISDDGVASWNAVKHADGYAYKINDDKTVYTSELEVQLEYGDSIRVKAVSDSDEYEDKRGRTL